MMFKEQIWLLDNKGEVQKKNEIRDAKQNIGFIMNCAMQTSTSNASAKMGQQ